MPYYGLYVPVKGAGNGESAGVNTTNANNSSGVSSNNEKNSNSKAAKSYVFLKKSEAFNVLKQHKDGRIKEFLSEEDAIKYAETGFEVVQNKYNDVKIKTSTASLEKAAFRAPTRQELVRFRSMIEFGDYDLVKKYIWDNPRYLVSSGDTPTTLKEGYRYNAMHICAISKRPQIAELILQTVSDIKFVDLLLGKNGDEKICKELAANLLDYYLNMPEKGRRETPLHIAAKNGCLEMVEVLTSYPECKMTRNKDYCLPKDIVFSRAQISNNFETLSKIRQLLDERYYVPVLRSNDNTIPGQIGEPFSANDPPTLNCDPLSPEMKIKALAGPMQKKKAMKFFRRWKTPPRLGSNTFSPIANNPFISPRYSTPTKTLRGLKENFNSPTAALQKRSLFNSTPNRNGDNETISSNGFSKSIFDDSFDDKQNDNVGKVADEYDYMSKNETNNNTSSLAQEEKHKINILNNALCFHTPSLKFKNDVFLNYRDQNMLSPMVGSIEMFEETNDSLLNISDIYNSPGYKERHVKNTDIEKGIECIGRELAKEEGVEWREYWDFLDEFVDIASDRGFKKLENYLAERQREQDQRNNRLKTINKPDILDDVCNALENAFRNTPPTSTADATTTNVSTTLQSVTPYTYVEKSLQVHAKRMTKTIIHNIDNIVSISDALLLELRRVKSLIYSFKEDASYVNVNFEKVHSRIGNLVSIFFVNSQEVSIQMKNKIMTVLQNLLLMPNERREHMECVCSRIFYMLENPSEQILPENLKTEEMCSKVWSQEEDCDCQWESNLSRKTTRRNRMEARYKNHQRLKQKEKEQKQMDKEHEAIDKGEWSDTNSANDSSDDVFWSDFGGSDSEEDEVFLTPPESPSLLNLLNDTGDDSDKIFIYGNEPTKRDLDVINAIFHIEIDETLYPNIYSWKSALMRYSNEEMDYFPSPRIVKKSHSFVSTSVQPQTPTCMQKTNSSVSSSISSTVANCPKQTHSLTSSSTSGILKEPMLQLPTAKRLFMSSEKLKSMTAITLDNNTNSNTSGDEQTEIETKPVPTTVSGTLTLNTITVTLPTQHQLQTQRPLTPLNKLRGLFSAYRERLDSSPLSTSVSPSNFVNENNSNDESNNSLSLLNVSASE